jgi:hypothetical protein
MLTLAHDNEAVLRGVLLLSLQQWATIQAGDKLEEDPIRRGTGRIPAIQAALAPYRGTLSPAALRRLTIGLSLIVGAESLVVLRDIWDLEETEAKEVARWIARTLAQATAVLSDPAARLSQLSRTYATDSHPPIAPRWCRRPAGSAQRRRVRCVLRPRRCSTAARGQVRPSG